MILALVGPHYSLPQELAGRQSLLVLLWVVFLIVIAGLVQLRDHWHCLTFILSERFFLLEYDLLLVEGSPHGSLSPLPLPFGGQVVQVLYLFGSVGFDPGPEPTMRVNAGVDGLLAEIVLVVGVLELLDHLFYTIVSDPPALAVQLSFGIEMDLNLLLIRVGLHGGDAEEQLAEDIRKMGLHELGLL